MAKVDVIMPQMGESIAEGTLTKWLKQVGESVERDEDLFEISTDKVDADIPSPASGTLVEVLVEEGATVEVNTVVARIETEAGAVAEAPAAESAAPEKATPEAGGAEDAAPTSTPGEKPGPRPRFPSPRRPPSRARRKIVCAPGAPRSCGRSRRNTAWTSRP